MASPKAAEISHYLGIDYGKSHVGLALADSETRIATAYGTLDNNRELFQKLAEAIQKEEISKVIVGIPMFLYQEAQGNKGGIYEDFAVTLSQLVPEIEIEFANEMFSTKIAKANLIERGVKGVKKHDHEEAARIILQGWLDSRA